MSNYIMDLRKIVGHLTLIQVAASVIIENDKGQILLGKRTDNHKWGYAGGSIEIDEKVEDCALRELYEETGLVGEELEFFMISSGKEVHYIYPNGDEVSNVEIIYTCNKYHGELKPQLEEISELRFFDIDKLPKDISNPLVPVLDEYVKRRSK
ncbi:MAG: NUDIX domain-containing protein [Firmicutes bacterium]|nr:NUDIX domain-containing protein [Candidatus Colivicinus equi]